MVNQVILVGRVSSDPVIEKDLNGKSTARMVVVTTRQDGVATEATYHMIVINGKAAESCQKYLKCGSVVYVDGRLHQAASGFEIIASNVRFLDGGSNWKRESEASGV